MEQNNQVSHDDPSLLMLNNDCFYPIFKFLEFDDFVNLAQTCSRLFFVAQTCKKFKNIKVTTYWNAQLYTVREFSNNLSVIGEHVASVYVDDVSDDILKTIADACTNLRSVELHDCSITALPFRNLRELKFGYWVCLSTDEWKNFFENNPGIVCLEYWDYGRNKCLPLLQMLPELKSLTIYGLELTPEEFHHLSCLTNLTRFSFTNWSMSKRTSINQLLIELAEKLNLLELDVRMPCDADTFAALKSFRCLEILTISNKEKRIEFPHDNGRARPRLRKISSFDISCSVFLSLVKQLKLLEQIDIRWGQIFWDNDETEYFPTRRDRSEDMQGSRIISRIANELRAEKRNLKIIFYENFCEAHQVWKYSDNLEITQRRQSDEHVCDHTFELE